MFDFDISFYIRVVRKWLWLVILTGAVVGAAAYFVLNLRSDEYRASTLIAVGTVLGNPDPGLEDVRLVQELTPTYARIVETRRVLEPVIEALELDVGVFALVRAIDTEAIPNTSLFVLNVTWSDPETAAAIANEVANQLIISNPSNLSPELQNQVELSQTQIELLSTQIVELREQLLTLDDRIERAETEVEETSADLEAAEEELAAAEAAAAEAEAAEQEAAEAAEDDGDAADAEQDATAEDAADAEQDATAEDDAAAEDEDTTTAASDDDAAAADDQDAAAADDQAVVEEPDEVALAEAAVAEAETAQTQAQQNLDALLAQRSDVIGQINQATATIAQLSSTITQIQQRTNALVIQQEATPPVSPVGGNTLLFTLAAAVGSAGLVGVAVLALEAMDTRIRSERRIEHLLELPVRGTVELGSRRQLAKTRLDSRLQEPYQMLRTNLVYSDSRTDTPIYIFSSPTNTERRALVLGNLALAAADSGSRVLLLDADLRRPDLTKTLQLSNEHGLVDFLTAAPETLPDSAAVGQAMEAITQREISERLDVIPSGSSTENPIRLLESPAMQRLVDWLRHGDYDFVIVNTPPIVLFPDASTLASLSGIEVLLILEHARSRSEHAVAALDQVQQIGGRLNGVIFVR